ncbi:tRNA dihydrouridine synthase [Desulfonatronovibrio magnus]|uniref:tRNA dihydrouridine synthase n=1 Tax=Desulfonatronovibrio magnus TaxID=698827 RepID=UPI0005EBE59C|nr:tRNA-dihydrouridine synthase family protein [Desulfonatronovibrio magnus]
MPITPDKPWLAPLAGFSDLPFRLLCRQYGSAAAFTEMISAKGLIYKTANTLSLLRTCPEDSPLVVQLYGNEPEVIYKATLILVQEGYKYFDLNCGCSVRKVTKTGAGAALMRNPDLLVEIFYAMAEGAGHKQCGIKFRLGWSHDCLTYLNIAEKLKYSGIGWITLHPRTATQLFSGKAAWKYLKTLKDSTPIPIIASGDLFTAQDAIRCIAETNVDNIMFARGALNNPAIFLQYLMLRRKMTSPEFNVEFIREICLNTVSFYRTYYPSHKAVLKMRTVLPRMIREIPGSKEIRKKIIACRNWDEIQEVITGEIHERQNTPC